MGNGGQVKMWLEVLIFLCGMLFGISLSALF